MSHISWEESYVGKLRKLIGNETLIHPSVRAIMQNDAGEVLFIERRGENKWGMPAGSMELGESVFDCLKREVEEETGLLVQEAVLVAIYTQPEKAVRNAFGDAYQMFELLFHVRAWSGQLQQETEESTRAQFFPLDQLPPASDAFWEAHHREVIADFQQFQGIPAIK